MSSKQGPRKAGMCASASADGYRQDVRSIFAANSEGAA
jgi:hypothetical protein